MNALFKLAILSGNTQAVSARLQHGRLVEAPDGRGYSPLMLAAEKGHLDICKLLVEHGADVARTTPSNKTAIDLAAANGHTEIVQLLAQFSQTPASVEENSFELWLSENIWEEDAPPTDIPPAQDAKLIAQAKEQELQFSRFIPVINGEDWTDIDIELPDEQLFEKNRKQSRLGSEYTGRVKEIIFHAKKIGHVNILQLKEEFGEHPSGEHIVGRLCEVLSAYDILTDEYAPNPFDELFREELSLDAFFHEDATDRDIFRDFLHAYNDDGQVFFSYFADVASTLQIQGDDMAELLEIRDKSVWFLLLLLHQCPTEISSSSAWRNLFDVSQPDEDNSADEDLNEPESLVFSSNLKQFYATFLKEFPHSLEDYTPVNMFKFLSIQYCDIDSIQNFFMVLLTALKDLSNELSSDSKQWGNDAKRHLDMLITSRSRMVDGNLRLALYFAKKYMCLGCEFADLVQEANIGLLRATGKYDSNREAAFSTYAVWWIRQSMMRYIQNSFNTIRIPVHVQNGAYGNSDKESHGWDVFIDEERSYEEIPLWLNRHAMMLTRDRELPLIKVRLDLLDDADKEAVLYISNNYTAEFDPEKSAVRSNMEEQIVSLLNGLKEKEKKVLMLRFGIEASHDHTLEEIGQRFGVTRERIRQIEVKALRKMRHPLRSKMVEVFQDD